MVHINPIRFGSGFFYTSSIQIPTISRKSWDWGEASRAVAKWSNVQLSFYSPAMPPAEISRCGIALYRRLHDDDRTIFSGARASALSFIANTAGATPSSDVRGATKIDRRKAEETGCMVGDEDQKQQKQQQQQQQQTLW